MVECRRVVLPYDDVIVLDKTPLKKKLIVKDETLTVGNVAFKVEDVNVELYQFFLASSMSFIALVSEFVASQI